MLNDDAIKGMAASIRAAKEDGTGDWRDIARREHELAGACTDRLNEILADGKFTARVVLYSAGLPDDAPRP
jgi:hypothetical protein